MRKGGFPDILSHLRRAAAVAGGDPTWRDADLLGRFVDARDGLAFEILVRRHAALAAQSARANGLEFGLFTNEPALVASLPSASSAS